MKIRVIFLMPGAFLEQRDSLNLTPILTKLQANKKEESDKELFQLIYPLGLPFLKPAHIQFHEKLYDLYSSANKKVLADPPKRRPANKPKFERKLTYLQPALFQPLLATLYENLHATFIKHAEDEVNFELYLDKEAYAKTVPFFSNNLELLPKGLQLKLLCCEPVNSTEVTELSGCGEVDYLYLQNSLLLARAEKLAEDSFLLNRKIAHPLFAEIQAILGQAELTIKQKNCLVALQTRLVKQTPSQQELAFMHYLLSFISEQKKVLDDEDQHKAEAMLAACIKYSYDGEKIVASDKQLALMTELLVVSRKKKDNLPTSKEDLARMKQIMQELCQPSVKLALITAFCFALFIASAPLPLLCFHAFFALSPLSTSLLLAIVPLLSLLGVTYGMEAMDDEKKEKALLMKTIAPCRFFEKPTIDENLEDDVLQQKGSLLALES